MTHVSALRCWVMPPPCIKNPYLEDASEVEKDPFGNQRSKCVGTILVYKETFTLMIFLEIRPKYQISNYCLSLLSNKPLLFNFGHLNPHC
ncbi:hypothetical protein PTKIN_Ptkin15bG0077500 [Pterospermum kingtungense]